MKSLMSLILSTSIFASGIYISTASASSDRQTDSAYELFEEAEKAGAERRAPRLMEEARTLYERAEREFGNGNDETAMELRAISQIKLKSAISTAKKEDYEDEIARLRGEIKIANSARQILEQELRKNVLRLTGIKEKNLISEEKMRSIALDMHKKSAEKIKLAGGVSAMVFAPDDFKRAEENYKLAEESLDKGEYEKAIKLSRKAFMFGETAYKNSKKSYDLGKEIIDKASPIYGAIAEAVEKGIRVTLKGVFATSGKVILFDAYPSLDRIGSVIAEYPDSTIIVEALSGSSKSKKGNSELSGDRIRVVKNHLASKGISTERLKEANGSGSDEPKTDRKEDGFIRFTINFPEPGKV